MELMVASFALVFLRAIQQQNVVHGRYVLAAMLPFALAVAEVATTLWVVNTGWSAVPYVGAGGAIGVVSAMVIYRRFNLVRR